MPGDDQTDPFEEPNEDAFSDEGLAELFPYDTAEFRALADDELDDELLGGPPLPLEDRIWRHPSELRFSTPPETAGTTVTSDTSRRNLALAGLGGGLISALLVFGLTQLLMSDTTERVLERRIESAAIRTTGASVRGPDVVGVANDVLPTIVRISVLDGEIEVGSGSGVVFRSDGHLLTNAHVVSEGDQLLVELADGRVFDGELIGADPRTDVAVVDIAANDLPVAALGSTENLRVGDWSLAIGSPLGLAGGPTVTLGVISALGRQLSTLEGGLLYDLIQTDAPIAPGSSGGALVDLNGGVIGITTAVAVSERGVEGLGFATPIDLAYSVATDLIDYGQARHSWLGIRGRGLPPAGDGERPGGIEVVQVVPGGPAEEAGLVPGDVVIALDGDALYTMSELITALRHLSPGDNVVLEVQRPRGATELLVRLGQRGEADEEETPTSTSIPS